MSSLEELEAGYQASRPASLPVRAVRAVGRALATLQTPPILTEEQEAGFARLAGVTPVVPPVAGQQEIARREPGGSPDLFRQRPITPPEIRFGRLKEVPEPTLPEMPTPEVSGAVRAAVTEAVREAASPVAEAERAGRVPTREAAGLPRAYPGEREGLKPEFLEAGGARRVTVPTLAERVGERTGLLRLSDLPEPTAEAAAERRVRRETARADVVPQAPPTFLGSAAKEGLTLSAQALGLYIDERLWGVPFAMAEAAGLRPPTPPDTAVGEVVGGLARLAGFIHGPARLAGRMYAGFLEPVATDAVRTVIAKMIAKSAAHLSVASGLAATGAALRQPSVREALGIEAEALKGGAVLGTIFGGMGTAVSGAGLASTMGRMGLGMALIDAAHGEIPFAPAAQALAGNRELLQTAFDYGINAYFLLRGRDPRRVLAALQAEANRGGKSPDDLFREIVEEARKGDGNIEAAFLRRVSPTQYEVALARADQLRRAGADPADAARQATGDAVDEVLRPAAEAGLARRRIEPPAPAPRLPEARAPLAELRPEVPAGPLRTAREIAGGPPEVPQRPAEARQAAQEAMARTIPQAEAAERLRAYLDVPSTFREFVEAEGRRWPITQTDPGYMALRQRWDELRQPLYTVRGPRLGQWEVVNRITGEVEGQAPSPAMVQLEANRLDQARMRSLPARDFRPVAGPAVALPEVRPEPVPAPKLPQEAKPEVAPPVEVRLVPEAPRAPEPAAALTEEEAAREPALPPAPPAVAIGRQMQIRTLAGRKYEVRFEIVEASDLLPSHDPFTFGKTPGYPEGVQNRPYHSDRAEQAKVIRQSQDFDPLFLISPQPSSGGTPIVAPTSDVVLSGNSRTMTLLRLRGTPDFQRYVDELRRMAPVLGVDPEVLARAREPVVVRRLINLPEDLDTLRRFAKETNEEFRQALSQEAQAVTQGRAISPDTLDWVAGQLDSLGEAATLKDLLRSSRDREIIRRFLKDGVWTERDLSRYVDARSGLLNDEGRRLVERSVLGSAVPDSDLLQVAPDQALDKIGRALAAVAKAKAAGPEWDLSDSLTGALRTLTDLRARGMRSVDEFRRQVELVPGPAVDPRADALARGLLERTPTEFRRGMDRYATRATTGASGQAGFGFEPALSPAEAFAESFGMPSAAMRASEAGGASRTAAIEAPPRAQPSAPQVSTQVIEPSETRRETVPLVREGPTRIVGTIDPTSKHRILQTDADRNRLFGEAERQRPGFEGFLRQAAEATGNEFISVRVKNRASVERKVRTRERPADTISDYLGGRIAVRNYREADRVVAEMARRGRILDDDAFFDTPRPDGYRARHVQIEIAPGFSAEIQLVPREIVQVQAVTHARRDRYRDVTEAPAADIRALIEENRRDFDAAWQQHLAATRRPGLLARAREVLRAPVPEDFDLPPVDLSRGRVHAHGAGGGRTGAGARLRGGDTAPAMRRSVLEEGQPLFLAMKRPGESDESWDRRWAVAFKPSWEHGVVLPGSRYRLTDTWGERSAEDLARRAQEAAYLPGLGDAVSQRLERVQTAVERTGPWSRADFAGFDTGFNDLGVNLTARFLGTRRDTLFLNPWALLDAATERHRREPAISLAQHFGEEVADTTFHELAHQRVRNHGSAHDEAIDRLRGAHQREWLGLAIDSQQWFEGEGTYDRFVRDRDTLYASGRRGDEGTGAAQFDIAHAIRAQGLPERQLARPSRPVPGLSPVPAATRPSAGARPAGGLEPRVEPLRERPAGGPGLEGAVPLRGGGPAFRRADESRADPAFLRDLAQAGRELRRTHPDYEGWAGAMRREFGERAAPHLERTWEDIRRPAQPAEPEPAEPEPRRVREFVARPVREATVALDQAIPPAVERIRKRASKFAADLKQVRDRLIPEAEVVEREAEIIGETGTLAPETRKPFREEVAPKPETFTKRVSEQDIADTQAAITALAREYRDLRREVEQGADPFSQHTVRAVQGLLGQATGGLNALAKEFRAQRFAAGRSVKRFDRPVPEDVLAALQEAGVMTEWLGRAKPRLPIYTNILRSLRHFPSLTQPERRQFVRDLVDAWRLNLFSVTSWSLDFVGNASEISMQVASGAGRDLVQVLRGSPNFPSLQALFRAVKDRALHAGVPLPEKLEAGLGATIGGERIGGGFRGALSGERPGTFTTRKGIPSRALDLLVGSPLYAKGVFDTGAKRLMATATVWRDAIEEANRQGLSGQDRRAFYREFLRNIPEATEERAIEAGNKAGFNRQLSEFEERVAGSTVVRLLGDVFARWPFQFTRTMGEWLGYNPVLFRDVVAGKASAEDVASWVVKTATGWGALYLLNETLYDRVDFNSMEYVHEDGNRTRLSNRDPLPTALWLLATLKGDVERSTGALRYASIPGARLLAGEGGLLGGLVSAVTKATERADLDAGALTRELTNQVNRAIPGQALLAAVESLFDPVIQEGIGAHIPGVSSFLEPAIKRTTGEPLEPRQEVLGVEIPTIAGTPIPGAKRLLDPVERLLSRYGAVIYRGPRVPIAGLPPVEVPHDILREWLVEFGQNRQRFLGPLAEQMDRGDFDAQNPDEVRERIMAKDALAANMATNVINQRYGTRKRLPRQPTIRERRGPVEFEEERQRFQPQEVTR